MANQDKDLPRVNRMEKNTQMMGRTGGKAKILPRVARSTRSNPRKGGGINQPTQRF